MGSLSKQMRHTSDFLSEEGVYLLCIRMYYVIQEV